MSGLWLRAPGRFALLLALIASLSLGAASCGDDEARHPDADRNSEQTQDRLPRGRHFSGQLRPNTGGS